jgi:nicotinamidase-related amidase
MLFLGKIISVISGGYMSKVAFLVVDMQKNCKEIASSKASFDKAVEYINEVSQYFRQKHHPVVIIQDVEAGGPETEGFECVDELVVSDKDYIIHKSYGNAFWETELDNVLKSKAVDCIIVSGFAAEHCVLFTYNGALERGYHTFLLQHGIAGLDEDEIKRIQLLRSVVSYEALEYFIKGEL